jgi:predicted alpha/beta hydrolase family esterase
MATSQFEHPSAAPLVLLLPDVDSEDSSYWQRHWADSRIDCSIVDVGASHRPDRNNWITRLDQATRSTGAPVLLVGHGVGALAIAWWAGLCGQEIESTVVGALLIGPPDPAIAQAEDRLQSFLPLPRQILPFPSLVVASENDPAVSVDRAFSMAREWGSGFARFGECGHFGAGDGLGRWRQGEQLLDAFIDLIEPGQPRLSGAEIDMVSGLVAQSPRPASQLRP